MARNGRPRLPKLTGDAQPTQADILAQLLMSATKAEQKELVQAIRSLAMGTRLWVGEGKKPGAKSVGVNVSAGRLILDSGEELQGFVYTYLPDMTAAKLLLDHQLGRPGQREIQQKDTAIILRHYVPGKQDQGAMPKAEAEPEVTLPQSEEVVEIGDEVLGYGAVFEADPEDVLPEGDDG